MALPRRKRLDQSGLCPSFGLAPKALADSKLRFIKRLKGARQVYLRRLEKGAKPEPRAQLPLNPLRAGAAAAYQDPANLRRRAAANLEGTSAAQEPSIVTIDGGSAKPLKDKDKKSADAPTPEQQSEMGEQREKKP